MALTARANADFVNGSFESGFSGWVTTDLTSPFYPLSIQTLGSANPFGGSWSSTPTNGNSTAFSGFDGNGPGVIRIAQDIFVPFGTTAVDFDWRAAYNLRDYGATLNRTFNVDVQAAGGGPNLASTNILTAVAGTFVGDTGPQTSAVNVSAFAGEFVRVSFDLTVPQYFTGPAQFQLDNVRLQNTPPTATPVPSTLVMSSILFGMFGAVSSYKRLKQFATAPCQSSTCSI